MPQSLSCVHIHLVFSTKNREPFLCDAPIRDEMHAYLGGIARKLDCLPVIVGGTEDHVHLLLRLGRTTTQADLVKELKRVSNTWIKHKSSALADFAWQGGYGAFSVSTSDIERTHTYIDGQQEHHKKMTFQDEYLAFLCKHKMEWDDRFVWE
jgi:REP element-mobilizing transposase RayT